MKTQIIGDEYEGYKVMVSIEVENINKALLLIEDLKELEIDFRHRSLGDWEEILNQRGSEK